MHPRIHAQSTPDKLALIFEPSESSITYAKLEQQANRAAQLFRSLGIKQGETVAFCLENCVEVFEFCWGAQRAGLYAVPISSRLTASEIDYILKDSAAKLLLTSDYLSAHLDAISQSSNGLDLYKTGAPVAGYADWAAALDNQSADPIEDESAGGFMLYSSGTTGNPKGIVPPPLADDAPIDAPDPLTMLASHLLQVDENSIYLSPAPLYHAAPLSWTMAMQRKGGQTVVMEKFDPLDALQLIEKHAVTCAQFVPTHFVRMLKLSKEERARHDVSSLQCAIHAAAPCPVPVKEAMIEWWGPIINEYYSGSEGAGMTFLTSPEWLEHKGSVGKPIMGSLHICDEEGNEVGPETEGQIFFEGGREFSYHNDAEKTAEAKNEHGWATLGDIGRIDKDGYLYLTDRKSFMIISGGVNIYPQEIENLLVTHPKVNDVAVIGAPDADMGEKVVAVVQPADMSTAGDGLAEELSAFCRTALSGVKVPRQIDFRAELPRTETGKLFKRELRDEYWASGSK